MNKQGVISDAILFVIMLFVISIALLVIYVAYDDISGALSGNSQIPADDATRFSDDAAQFPVVWDFVFLTIFVGVVAGILIISYLLATQPVFFFVFMFVVVILGGLAGYIANAFDEIILDPILSASAANFPIMSFIMTNYLIFVVVTIMLMLIVFYAKPNTEAGF